MKFMKKLLLIEAANVKSIGMMNQIVCFADILKESKIDFNIIGNNKLKEFCPSLDLLIFSNLNFINKYNDTSFIMTYSYGRALQQSALKFWSNDIKNIEGTQKVFNHRANMCTLAAQGKWSAELEAK